MATKTTKKADEGEWKHHVLGEHKIGKTIWRAQASTAPDGKEFAGVRKFAVKADGTEQVTRDGLSFLVNDELDSNIAGVIAMLQQAAAITKHAKKLKTSAQAAKAKVLNKAKPKKVSEAKVVKPAKFVKAKPGQTNSPSMEPAEGDDRKFALKNSEGKYIVSADKIEGKLKLVLTPKSERAFGFDSVAGARAFRESRMAARADEFKISKL